MASLQVPLRHQEGVDLGTEAGTAGVRLRLRLLTKPRGDLGWREGRQTGDLRGFPTAHTETKSNPSLAWAVGICGRTPSGQTGTQSSQPETSLQAQLQEPLGEGTSGATTRQPGLPFSPSSICISLETPLLFPDTTFLRPRTVSTNTSDFSLTLESPPPIYGPSLTWQVLFVVLKSLSLSRVVRAPSAPHLLQAGPHPNTRLLCPSQTGTLLNSGSREPAAWRAPTWEPKREAAPLRSPGPPFPAPRSLQGDLALWSPTFLEEGKWDRRRQKKKKKSEKAKRVVGPSTYLQQEQEEERGEAAAPGSHGWPGKRRANSELGCGRAGPG